MATDKEKMTLNVGDRVRKRHGLRFVRAIYTKGDSGVCADIEFEPETLGGNGADLMHIYRLTDLEKRT